MIVYFDESYDHDHEYLLLGCLFSPHPEALHRKIGDVKRENGYVYKSGPSAGKPKEIKYSTCDSAYDLRIASQMVDAFARSTSWFRCIVIDQRPGNFDLERFGQKHENEAIKKARAYKKFAEMLLTANTRHVAFAVLLTDRLTRCRGDLFIPLMEELYSTPGQGLCTSRSVIFRHIMEVDTALEDYQLGQVNDILLGCVLNAVKPAANQFKNGLRQHVQQALGLPSLAPAYWSREARRETEEKYPKFGVWAWKPTAEALQARNGPTQVGRSY